MTFFIAWESNFKKKSSCICVLKSVYSESELLGAIDCECAYSTVLGLRRIFRPVLFI